MLFHSSDITSKPKKDILAKWRDSKRNAEYRTKRVREYSEKIGNDKEGSFGGYHQEKESINGVETWTGWTTNEFEKLRYKRH